MRAYRCTNNSIFTTILHHICIGSRTILRRWRNRWFLSPVLPRSLDCNRDFQLLLGWTDLNPYLEQTCIQIWKKTNVAYLVILRMLHFGSVFVFVARNDGYFGSFYVPRRYTLGRAVFEWDNTCRYNRIWRSDHVSSCGGRVYHVLIVLAEDGWYSFLGASNRWTCSCRLQIKWRWRKPRSKWRRQVLSSIHMGRSSLSLLAYRSVD